MRILLLTHAQYITVALPKVIEYAEHLIRAGHKVMLVATSRRNRFRPERFTNNGVNYLISPSLLFGRFRHGADLFDSIVRYFCLRNERFDIIHAVDSRPTVIIPALLLKYTRGTRLVLEWSDLFGDGGTIKERSNVLYQHTFGIIETFLEKNSRRFADGHLVISRYLFNRVIKMGFQQKNVMIHRMGCDINKYQGLSKKMSREFLSINPSSKIFVYLGQLYPKDHQLLVESFALLLKKTVKDVELFIVGNNTPLIFDLPTKIHYTGWVSKEEYKHYLSASDICLLPLSLTKANKARWPSKITDYLAAGKPVIATSAGDVEEIYDRKNIGILIRDPSTESFMKAMLDVLRNEQKWNFYGRNSKEYARENLDWNILVSKAVQFFQRITDC